MIKLQPGDYVATADIKDEAEYHAIARAFMEAGADKLEYPDVDYFKSQPLFGWSSGQGLTGLYHGSGRSGVCFTGRQLTPAQILDTPQWVPEVGGRCVFVADQEGDAFTSSGLRLRNGDEVVIRSLFTNGNDGLIAAIELDNHACTCIIASCLQPLPTNEDRVVEKMVYYISNFIDVLDVSGDQEREACHALYRAIRDGKITGIALTDKQPQPAEDMSDPANWRAGDLFSVTDLGDKYPWWNKKITYKAFFKDDELRVKDGDGHDRNIETMVLKGWLIFHSRP